MAESTWTKQAGSYPIVTELVEQLSAITDADPLDGEPLATSINPAVFRELRTGGDSPWQLRFQTARYEVRVNSHGTITVYDDQLPAAGASTDPISSSGGRRAVAASAAGASEKRSAATRSVYPARAVYETVAAHEGVEPADLPPLDNWVHPATRDALTGSWTQLDRSREFHYLWYHVTVHPSGDVTLRA